MDSSFIRAADPRLIRHVDINRCDGGGEQRGAIDGAESRRPKWDQINHDWTASDRARRVSQDHRLQRLLVAEVKQSGCVTAAGYHAIFRNFIYSDAVEKNMNQDPCHGGGGGRARSDSSASKFGGLMISGMTAPAVSAHAHCWGDPPKRKDDNNKSSLFSSLFSGMTASTVSAGMTESNLSCSLTAFRRRSTENSSRSVMRRRNSSNLSTLDDGPRTSNLAPRRASGDGPAPVDFEAPAETRPKEESQQTKEESQREYERPSRPRLKFNEVDFDPKCAATNGESNGRKADPKTEDAVNNETPRNDGEDAEDLIHYLLNVNETRPRSPNPERREEDDDDDDADADEEDCSSLSSASDSSSDCGWLPWPEDSADDSTSNVSISDGRSNDYEGCSNCSKSCSKREEGASFLPWPVTPIGDELLAAPLPAKNELARAA